MEQSSGVLLKEIAAFNSEVSFNKSIEVLHTITEQCDS